jgi:diaminopimelate decarboxylase
MSAHRSSRPSRWLPRSAPLAALGEFEIYDLGGGLGARYTWADQPPSVAEYLDVLIGAAREHLPAAAQIIIEPGRSMVATSAATIYRVITIKRGKITVRRCRRRHG